MKLVSYKKDNLSQSALLIEGQVYDTDKLCKDGPATMQQLLQEWDRWYPLLVEGEKLIRSMQEQPPGYASKPLSEIALLAPVPHPPSCRDGYAFRRHVAAARRNRGAEMIPEFDQYPVLYFTNHHSIIGPGPVPCMPDHFEQLDFELEAAIVVCREGRNIRAEEAGDYIGGLMIMNDLSARRLQREEMLLNLGPAKGKDFATALGPWLVTKDELAPFETAPKQGHAGTNWNLKMTCHINGVQVSEGNLGDMDWSFAELIERASYGATLFPGDVIGSGTVGTGCFLELNGTAKLQNPTYQEQWLREGDRVELEGEALGKLINSIVREQNDWSILQRKKGAAARALSRKA